MVTRDPLSAVVQAHRAGQLPNEGLVVGFSGGPDSCALLHALVAAATPRVLAVHVDHAMRPESSDDAAKAANIAAALGVPCRIVRLESPPGGETAAREARHAALAAAAREHAGQARPVVALGHTADDQVETLLLRFVRGTGISGLRGMGAWEPGPAGAWIARPLLGLARAEIEAYVARVGIAPLADPTNADPAFADRNKLRLGAMPVLRELNPRLVEAAARLASLAGEDDTALEEWAARELARLQGTGGIPVEELLALPLAISRRVIRSLAADLSFDHVERILEVASGKRPGHTHLPGGRVAVRAEGRLQLGAGPPPDGAGCRICLTQGGLVPSMKREFGN